MPWPIAIRPEVFGSGANQSPFGSSRLRRNELTGIADAQGTSFTDAGTTREGAMATRLAANPYLTEVSGQGGGIPTTFSANRDSQVLSFLASTQQGRSLEDKPALVAGTSLAAGLGEQMPMGAHASQGIPPPQVPGCVPLLPGASGGNAEVQNIGSGTDVPVQAIGPSELVMLLK